MILVMVLFLLFGSTFTLGKAALSYAPVLFALGVRMLFGGGLLLAYLYCIDRKRWKWQTKDIVAFLQLMVFHVYLTFVPEFWAMKYVSSAKACLVFNLAPFITALFSYLFLSERMTTRKWLGLAIGISGFIPIVFSQASKKGSTGGGMPELALIIAVASASYAWTLITYLVNKRGYSPLMLNGIAMTSGSIFILGTSLFTEGIPAIGTYVASDDVIGTYFSQLTQNAALGPYMFILYTVLLIIVANFISYNLYGYLLRKYSATFMAFAGFTTPLFTALWGWLLLGEVINTVFFISISITFWGLYIFYREEGRIAKAG